MEGFKGNPQLGPQDAILSNSRCKFLQSGLMHFAASSIEASLNSNYSA